MDKPTGDVKSYLDYLDKEMTIQGVLAVFAVAIIGLVLDKVLGAEPEKKSFLSTIQTRGFAFVMLGSGAVALAALFFYLQRSYLAHIYGKIASALTNKDAPAAAWESSPLAGRISWSSYQCGFGMLMVAVAEYVLALASKYDVVAMHWAWWGFSPFLLGLVGLLIWFQCGAKREGASTLAETIESATGRLGGDSSVRQK